MVVEGSGVLDLFLDVTVDEARLGTFGIIGTTTVAEEPAELPGGLESCALDPPIVKLLWTLEGVAEVSSDVGLAEEPALEEGVMND